MKYYVNQSALTADYYRYNYINDPLVIRGGFPVGDPRGYDASRVTYSNGPPVQRPHTAPGTNTSGGPSGSRHTLGVLIAPSVVKPAQKGIYAYT